MKTIQCLMTITLLAVHMATAGDKSPAEAEDWMKQAIAKERQRAEEAAEQFGNTKRFEEKFAWAKEKQPELYSAFMAANRKAAEKWTNLVRKSESASHPDSLAEAKQLANAASSEAYLAEMEMKYAGSEAERKHMMEKANSPELAGLAIKLAVNERAILAANRLKHESTAAAEKLQLENRALSKAFQDVSKKAREDQKGEEPRDDRKREEEKRHQPMPPKERAPQID